MKMNWVPFQPGLSMPELCERYGTEAKCRAAVEAARWPDGFVSVFSMWRGGAHAL